MAKETMIRLTPAIYEKYWAYIPDSDIVSGSDGCNYVYEKAFIFYVNAKTELERTIAQIERGTFPNK